MRKQDKVAKLKLKPAAGPQQDAALSVAPAETPAAERGAPLTMAELLAEQYPQGAPARVAGGMAIALQRELRRRNRKAEKGY